VVESAKTAKASEVALHWAEVACNAKDQALHWATIANNAQQKTIRVLEAGMGYGGLKPSLHQLQSLDMVNAPTLFARAHTQPSSFQYAPIIPRLKKSENVVPLNRAEMEVMQDEVARLPAV
jgi:hypothetical protein